jgi:glutamate racemase
MDTRPIGIFDSGVGGLTVVKAVKAQLQNESIVYFGDTARVPYGCKSKETVTKFSAQIIRFLRGQNVKAIIIACNTVNTNSIEALREMFPDILIEGVVEAGVHMALEATKGTIGVIGTESTVQSERYPQLLHEANKELKVYQRACPLFVPLVEDGWTHHEVAKMVAKEYLSPMLEKGIDSLILGCTHYPMLMQTIGEVVGEEVKLINPAKEAARRMGLLLQKEGLEAPCRKGEYDFFVSDDPKRMQNMAKVFLKDEVGQVEKIDIEAY